MAEIRTAIVMAASLSAPVGMVATAPMLMDQPLATGEPSEEILQRHETMRFSQIAISGQRIFRAKCADCHGEDASGTRRGPDLVSPAGSSGRSNDKRMFHHAVTQGVPQQNWAMGDMPAFPRLSFNQIERIERYVRELRYPVRLRRG